jgi:hypothetical protein
MTQHPFRTVSPSTAYTPSDLAWFRRPLKLAAMLLAFAVAVPVANANPKASTVRVAGVEAVVTVKPVTIVLVKPATEAQKQLDIVVTESHMKRDIMFHNMIKKGAK